MAGDPTAYVFYGFPIHVSCYDEFDCDESLLSDKLGYDLGFVINSDTDQAFVVISDLWAVDYYRMHLEFDVALPDLSEETVQQWCTKLGTPYVKPAWHLIMTGD